jgi:hypothetical protein
MDGYRSYATFWMYGVAGADLRPDMLQGLPFGPLPLPKDKTIRSLDNENGIFAIQR